MPCGNADRLCSKALDGLPQGVKQSFRNRFVGATLLWVAMLLHVQPPGNGRHEESSEPNQCADDSHDPRDVPEIRQVKVDKWESKQHGI